MKKAAPGRGAVGKGVDLDCSDPLDSTASRSKQLLLFDGLRRLHHLRRDLDHWHGTGRRGPMPQLARFGLRLPAMGPGDVYWRDAHHG